MRAWEIGEEFGLEHLRLVDRPDPTPGPDELLLRMRAMSLNYRDLLTVEGRYDPDQPLPLVPCSDGVGVVAAVGEEVDEFEPGDRVCPIFAPRWIGGPPTRGKIRTTLGGPLDGTLRELMTVPASAVVAIPDEIGDEAAATLPCAAVTAWNALVVQGQVRAGQTVLVLGTGGVALFALQIARLLGARVVITSSSDEKLERALDLGAWRGVNYREEPEWGKHVKETTGGGVDHVVELGGATLPQSLHAVCIGGTVSIIGTVAGIRTEISVVPILMRHVRLQGIIVGSRDAFGDLVDAFAQHRAEPVIDRVFPFEEVSAAFERLDSGDHLGKIVVTAGES